MEKNVYFPKVQDIEKASERLKEILAPTPLQLNAHFSNKYGCDVYLKREDHTRFAGRTTRSARFSRKCSNTASSAHRQATTPRVWHFHATN